MSCCPIHTGSIPPEPGNCYECWKDHKHLPEWRFWKGGNAATPAKVVLPPDYTRRDCCGGTVETSIPYEWAYGVMTVPARRTTLLPRTLASLAEAGFDRPHLFVDGEADPESWRCEFGLDVTAHHPALRAVGNWVTALWTLYVRNPDFQRYAIFQDDLVAVKHLRAYLDSQQLGERQYWNLYSSVTNEAVVQGKPAGTWHEGSLLDSEIPERGLQRGVGALGLVFSLEGVLALLGAQSLVHKPLDVERFPNGVKAGRGHHNIDGMVVTAMNLAGWREMVHAPSLLQHTGQAGDAVIGEANPMSVMGEPKQPHWVMRLAMTFPGEHFDARSLIR